MASIDSSFASPSASATERPAGPVVAIVGPTAVGKSALALDLAARWVSRFGSSAEIISADSRQIYRGLDIGTAKPLIAEQQAVRHHLIDVVDPEDDFSVAEFQDRAYLAIHDALRRDALPLVVGGTGLYVRAILEGIQLPRVAADPELRSELELVARDRGPEALHGQLAVLDPVAATRIDPRNVRRVIRAIEVTVRSGRPFSDGSVARPRYNVLRLGLTMDRDALYRHIDERVDRQVEAGLVEETRRVLDRGCPPTRPSLSGFGYRQMVAYLAGECDLASAVQHYKFATHRFAKQQYGWFRLNDPRVVWLTAGAAASDDAFDKMERFLRSSG